MLLGLAAWTALVRPLGRLTWALVTLLTIVFMLGRYAEVTAPALYGRPVNLYWDAEHLPKVGAMLAEVAAMELGARRIRVNAVGPGLVRTGLTDLMWGLPALVEDYVDNQSLPDLITVDDIAASVAFLASDDARAVSGTLQLVDGAAHTQRYPDMLKHFGVS